MELAQMYGPCITLATFVEQFPHWPTLARVFPSIASSLYKQVGAVGGLRGGGRRRWGEGRERGRGMVRYVRKGTGGKGDRGMSAGGARRGRTGSRHW